MNESRLYGLLRQLITLSGETEWLERKLNNTEAHMIGERVSAIANSAALNRRNCGYIIFGVADGGEIVGTSFDPDLAKGRGNEPIETWLHAKLEPKVDFRFHKFYHDGKKIVILMIPSARSEPVQFDQHRYIRIGSITKKLREHVDKERELWRVLSNYQFESDICEEGVGKENLFELLSFKSYFGLKKIPIPPVDEQVNIFEQEGLISVCDDGLYDITNLGGILFAKDLDKFPSLKGKAMRVVEYEGKDRTVTRREQQGKRGYAAGFEMMISYLLGRLPSNEVIDIALRRDVPLYPPIAIRELSANTLVHQDFSVSGAGPMIEIFKDRIEFTNPGDPLIDPQRFIDLPHKSRNEKLARMMRGLGICEERGSGIDKVVQAIETFQLPAPDFSKPDGSTRAVLFAPKSLSEMNEADRVRACYQHACLMRLSNKVMSNSSLRERLGISEENAAQASRIISETKDRGLIKEADPDNASRRYIRYLPYWA